MQNKLILPAAAFITVMLNLFAPIAKVPFFGGLSLYSEATPLFFIIANSILGAALLGAAVYYFLKKDDMGLIAGAILAAVLFLLDLILLIVFLANGEEFCHLHFMFFLTELVNLAMAVYALYLHPVYGEKIKALINNK